MKKIGAVHFKFALMFLVLAVFLVSGQQGCPSFGEGKVDVVSQGLELSFVNEAPPLTVSVNQEFPIYVEVLNKGGQFINQGEANFYLSGIGSNLEGVSESQTNSRNLAKESITPDRIVFAENARFAFPIESLYTLPLALISCYAYGTATQASVCVSSLNESRLCTVGAEKINSNSNSVAPIQITSLKEEVVGNKLRVLFTIANKLNGKVYLPDTSCDKLLSKESFSESFKQDKVRVEIRTTEQGFSCKLLTTVSPYLPLDATTGNTDLGTVVCEKELEGKKNNKAPFSIILRYKYVESVLSTINIVP